MVDNVITNAESTESKEVQLYNKFKEVMGISPAFGMYNKEKEYRLYKEIVEDLGRILIMDGTHTSLHIALKRAWRDVLDIQERKNLSHSIPIL